MAPTMLLFYCGGRRGAFCCSMWLRKNMFRAVAGSESFRLHCRRMNKRPCGGSRRAAARQLAREMRVRQRCRLRKCLSCVWRGRVDSTETPATCRAVCAETYGRPSAADGGQKRHRGFESSVPLCLRNGMRACVAEEGRARTRF